MWTQRDQLQAGQFLRRRTVSALQFGDANHPVAPGRRVSVGAISGVAGTLLVMSGFLVFGLVRPGGTVDWRVPGQILIEKESGAVHVLGADGLVHPVVNYASARLLTGGAKTVSIPAGRLADAPRGRPLGIPAAPDSLPGASRLIAGPWTVCSGGEGTTVLVGTPLPASGLPTDQAIVVTAPGGTETASAGGAETASAGGADAASAGGADAASDGGTYLVADGRKYRMRGDAAVALGYDGVVPLAVSDGWLGVLPSGADLVPRAVRGAGNRGVRVGGEARRVGQVLRAEDIGGRDRYYVVAKGGLNPVTPAEAALILAAPENRVAYPDGVPRALPVAAADIAASGEISSPVRAEQYPTVLPKPVSTKVICAGTTGDGVRLWASGAAPVPAGAKALTVTGGVRIYVTAGHGVLAGGDAGTATLVTDQGVRFAVDEDDLDALGYRDVAPSPVDAKLLDLLPSGPRLSAEAAREEATA
ncbi:type VII secretion protein EccB [Actinoplanes sp. NPDC051851]|uniref:type VII secretion protein EccB n=1 Tax=Actinoplanes sp. NPDC051851 TaxID=3154753 RepID=UPI0034180C2A